MSYIQFIVIYFIMTFALHYNIICAKKNNLQLYSMIQWIYNTSFDWFAIFKNI